MPFISTEPQNGQIVDADFLRAQLNAVNYEAVAVPTLAEEGSGGVQLCVPLILLNVPAADPHVLGAVWNNAGVLMISAG